jgi:hypothetical protein
MAWKICRFSSCVGDPDRSQRFARDDRKIALAINEAHPSIRVATRHMSISGITRRPPIVSDGQQNTPAVHNSGPSRVQLVNLANIAAYVFARIS